VQVFPASHSPSPELVKKSLGRPHGFQDRKQGNIFFHIAEIISEKRPKAFFLENVKNLVSHDKGNTFRIIRDILEGFGYSFDFKVLDGRHFVPQHRERIFIVGFDKKAFGKNIKFDFRNVNMPETSPIIKTILESNPHPKYTLSDKLWDFLQRYAAKHQAKGNGFGYGLADINGVSRTLSARYYKDGSEILIPQSGINPRRLTPRECAALQGYPIFPINTDDPKKSFAISVSDNQAYKQFGNSVIVPLIQSVGKELITTILRR